MAVSKGLKVVGLLALGLGTVAIFKKAGHLITAANLDFDLTKINIVGLNKVYAILKISNATSGTVDLSNLNANVFFNKVNIGRLFYNKVLPIAQNSYQTVSFPIALSPSGEIEILSNIINSRPKEGVFLIDGKVSVNNVPVPINKTIKSW